MPIVNREPIVDSKTHAIIMSGDVTFGRKRIYTEKEITEGNIKEILNDALSVHNQNVAEMELLIQYYLGNQQILKRNTPYTSNVNNKIILNYAQSVVRDIVGYTFGKDL